MECQLINAFGNDSTLSGKASDCIMQLVDTETLLDFESGWPRGRLGSGETEGLNAEEFNRDIRSTLIDKAKGDIRTRITNAKMKA